MSLVPSRPLAVKTSGARQPAFASSVVFARSSSSRTLPSDERRSCAIGRQIDARPRVDVHLTVRRIRHRVIGGCVGERRQAGAVEVDAIEVREVRILLRIHAAGAEIDLAVGLVDALHGAHDELALGDLVLHRARGAVEQVQVRPSVALGQPHDFGAIVDVGAVDAATAVERARGAAIVDERCCLFVDQERGVARAWRLLR